MPRHSALFAGIGNEDRRMNRNNTPLPTDRHITYQTQYRKCGKKNCRICNAEGSKGHGPYTYAFWHDDQGKMHSKYVGKAKEGQA
jgi:Family of unknown function (DUF6788)